MSAKSKGSNAERNLIHLLWSKDWAAIRVAGSGSCHYPAPDILAGNNLRKLAIECKCTKDSSVYLTKKEVIELKEFSTKFGAESWLAIKFDRKDWYFVMLEDAKETENSFMVSEELIKNKGLLLEEVIR